MKIILTFVVVLLFQHINSMEIRKDEDETPSTANENDDARGIISDLLFNRPSLNPGNNLPQPPMYVPNTAGAVPTFNVPSLPSSNRPSILGSLFSGSGIDLDKDKLNGGLNTKWVNYALQKCARIDPRMLTAILPTTTNKIIEPRMYYIENSTSNVKTWPEAQEWCTSKGMDLVSVNDMEENSALQELIRKVLGNSQVDANPLPADSFWVGLNDAIRQAGNGVGTLWTYIGDSTASIQDWHGGTQSAVTNGGTAGFCAAYNQLVSTGNIHLSNLPCTTITLKRRFICEVDEACAGLFAARYRTHHHVYVQSNEVVTG